MDLERVDKIVEQHGSEKDALLAILQDVQASENWLPREALQRISDRLEIGISHIYRMATFFEAFSLEPRGEHICTVCMGTACHVRGAPRLLDKLSRDLKVDAGETREDGKFTLEQVNCVGACALGPLVIMDGEYHGNMTSRKVDKLLKSYDNSSEEASDEKD